jgi:hypothetical protein
VPTRIGVHCRQDAGPHRLVRRIAGEGEEEGTDKEKQAPNVRCLRQVGEINGVRLPGGNSRSPWARPQRP